MPLNRIPVSRVNIGDVVTKLNTIQTIKTIDDFNAQKQNLVQAVENLKVHLTDQDTQISDLTRQVSDGQAQATALKSENDLLKQQVNARQATIDQLNARLAAVAAQPPPANPVALADSFRKVVDQIQAQARLQAAGGPATTIRSMDIEVKGLVNVQDGNTVLVLPTLNTQVDPNQLSTLRVSFAAIPATGRAAAPAVTGISPGSGPASGGTSITVTGSGFTGAGAVQFGGTPAATFSVVNDTQMVAVSPPGNGTVDVVVVTASGGASSTGAVDQFTYIPAPAVTGISPSRGPTAGGTTVTVSGTGFGNVTGVTFGTIAASFKVSVPPTQITAVSPAGTGTVHIVVTTPGGNSGTSQADQFTYTSPVPGLAAPAPTPRARRPRKPS